MSRQREDENPHDGELTFLGRVLAQLPVNQQLGKLIVPGHVFGCLDECLIIGECGSREAVMEGNVRLLQQSYLLFVFSLISGISFFEEFFCDAF